MISTIFVFTKGKFMAKTVFISSNKKSIIKRIVLFGVFFLIAVISLTYGVHSCAQQYQPQEGLQKIELDSIRLPNDEVVTPFENEINFYYYIEKTDDYSISENFTIVSETYQQIAYAAYLSFHPDYEFDEYKSLAYIDHHPNEEIQVSEFLYDALYDAYQKTIVENSPYNVFSGKIYDFWEELMYSNTKNPDPAFSSNSQQRLAKIVASLNQKESYRLEFNPEKRTITYVLSDESLKEDLKLDLNVLYEAYVIQTIADYFKSYQLQKGYFVSQNGYFLHLQDYWTQDEMVELAINIYAKENEDEDYQTMRIGSFTIDGRVVGSTFTNYYLSENDGMKYQIVSDENVPIRRHLYYDASTGYPLTNIRYSRIYSNNPSAQLVDISYDNLKLMTLSKEDAYAFVQSNEDQQKRMLYIVDNGALNDVIDKQWLIYYQNIDSFDIEETFQDRFVVIS